MVVVMVVVVLLLLLLLVGADVAFGAPVSVRSVVFVDDFSGDHHSLPLFASVFIRPPLVAEGSRGVERATSL